MKHIQLFILGLFAISLSAHAQKADLSKAIFVVVEQSATFNGGDISTFSKWIANNLRYPEEAIRDDIQGRAFVQFVVTRKGKVDQIKVIRSSGSDLLDKEAIRVISESPKWKPALQGGQKVNQQFTVPINFIIQ